jgi:hypothetical protein
MTNENYKATDSALIDPPEPAVPARPRNVNIALGLIVGALLIPLLASLKALQEMNFNVSSPLGIWIAAAGYLILGVICHQIAQGRRWARMVQLIIVLVTFATMCWALGYIWRQAPEVRGMLMEPELLLTRVVPLVMNLIALHLLYFSSGDWFRKRN